MIECQICLREFSDGDVGRTPRILTNCGHTLCEKCANKLLMGCKITCPFDRKITALGGTGVKGLQKNFSLLESLEGEVQTVNGATKTGIPCAENPSHDAALYCQQCEIDLCEICFVRIHRPKVLASHKRIDISEKPLELPKCNMHSLNTAEFFCIDPYCKTPDKIMCHVCMTTQSHKSHKYGGLRELIKKNKNQLNCILKSNKSYGDTCKEWIQLYTNAIKSFDMTGEMYQKAEKVIIDTFDEGKKKALEDLRSYSKREVASMKKVNDALKENLHSMEELFEDISRKAEMNIVIGNVDEMRRWKEVEANFYENIKNRNESHFFDGDAIFLPVLNLKFSKTWDEKKALENSGLVCIHHVMDYNKHNRSNE